MKMNAIHTAVLSAALIVTASMCSSAKAALIPPEYLDCVVAIGTTVNQSINNPDGSMRTEQVWATEGTGFLYSYLVHDDVDASKKLYRIYLVTAAHVITNHPVNSELDVRVNSNNLTKAPQFSIPSNKMDGTPSWSLGIGQDVAVTLLDANVLMQQNLKVKAFGSDTASADSNKLMAMKVAEGDGIFVLGFPMNLAGVQKNYVIVRQGSIARIGELLDKQSPTFLIDALVFPGNSGGPVVLRPDSVAINGTVPQLNSLLIGMVISYTPFDDVAVSQQTHKPRVVFEENSGLAQVVSVDAINAVIAQAESKINASIPVSPTQVKPDQPTPALPDSRK